MVGWLNPGPEVAGFEPVPLGTKVSSFAADALAARVDGRVETRRARCAAMGRILRDDASRSTRPAAPGESPPGESPRR